MEGFVRPRHGLRMKSSLTLNPGVPHPGLLPSVISLKPLAPTAYNKGFKNPNGGRFFDSLASFNRLISPANEGAEAEVPPMRASNPSKNIRKSFAWAETSGIPYIMIRVRSLG